MRDHNDGPRQVRRWNLGGQKVESCRAGRLEWGMQKNLDDRKPIVCERGQVGMSGSTKAQDSTR